MQVVKFKKKINLYMSNIILNHPNDVEISNNCDFIDKKLNKGMLMKDISLPLSKTEILNLVLYIFSKDVRTKNDLSFLKHFLSSMPSFVNTIHQYKINNDYELLMHKISIFLRCEFFEANSIVCVNGEIGDKYYIVFQGSVAVLVPKQFRIQLTHETYYEHLKNLLQFQEFDIFNRTLECNRHVFLSRELFEMTQGMDDTQHLTKTKNVSVNDYINRIQPTINDNDKNNSKINFTLWGYHRVCILSQGASFGDVALSGENKRRTATIITVEDSDMGTITKNVYESSMKEAQEKIRKQNVEKIRSHEIFKGYSPDTFDRVFFNYFKLIEFHRGDAIFSQQQNKKEIYFIKEGEIQVSTKGTFMSLDWILEKLGDEPIPELKQKRLLDMKMSSESFTKYYYTSKVFSLYIIKAGDCIGTDEYEYDHTYFTSAHCISQKCEIFALEIYFFNMFLKQYRIMANYSNMMKKKKKMMIKRIKDIKEISIAQHYNTVRPIFSIDDKPRFFHMPKMNETTIKKPILLTHSSFCGKTQEKYLMTEVTPMNRSRNSRLSLEKTKTKTQVRVNSVESPKESKRKVDSLYSKFSFLTHTLFPKDQTLKKLIEDSNHHSKIQTKISLSQRLNKRLSKIDFLIYDTILEKKHNKTKTQKIIEKTRIPKLKIIKGRKKLQKCQCL